MDEHGHYVYLIELAAPGMLRRQGRALGKRFDMSTSRAQAQREELMAEQAAHVRAMAAALGREPEVTHYFLVTHSGLAARLTPGEAEVVLVLPGVTSVERERLYELTTYLSPSFIGADAIWDGSAVPGSIGTMGEGMVIASLDSGVSSSHPSFANDAACGHGVGGAPDKLISSLDCSSTDAGGLCNGSGWEDDVGHGSHTASTACGNTLDGTADPPPAPPSPFTEISGVAPCAHIRSYKVCPTNTCPGADIQAGMNSILIHGDVDAMNFSISGGTSPWADNDRRKLDLVDAGVFVAASAGNTGLGIPNPVGRVNHRGPWVLSVAASTRDRGAPGAGDVLADFSLRGPTPAPLQDLTKPDVTGPGVSIYAAVPTSVFPGGYATASGTSMSSPHAAGAATLLRAVHPDWTVTEVKSALMTTAFKGGTKENGTTPWDADDVGSGRLDLTKAARAGLVMDESFANYLAADPASGGDVKTLNTPSVRDMSCSPSCTWTRTVRNTLDAPTSWTATGNSLTPGFEITVEPASFDFGGDTGETQELTITATPMTDLTLNVAFGEVVLSESGGLSPDQHLTVAIRGDDIGPIADVSPESFAFEVPRDGTAVDTLSIGNTGTAALEWSLAEAEGVSDDKRAAAAQYAGVTAGPLSSRGRRTIAHVGDSQSRALPRGETLLAEGFEDGTMPPPGWTHEISNADGTWEISSLDPHSGTLYASVFSNPAPQDEWLISPPLSLDGGTLTFWSFGSLFNCRDVFDNCDLNVWIVVGEPGGGDDIFVGLADDDWSDDFVWAQSSFDLTGLSPGGEVRIGFQYTGENGAEISLDTITLTGGGGAAGCDNPVDVPWLSVDPAGGTTPPGGDVSVDVTVDAAALGPGDYAALLCVTTNDQEASLVEIPVGLTVLEDMPAASISPDAFAFEVPEGGAAADTLSIGNVGAADLEWSITTDTAPTGELTVLGHDPALDETLDIPDFDLISASNGGSPVVVTLPAGVVTRGDVVGFSFVGTASGVTGSDSWASDTCMIVRAPNGATFGVGGLSGTNPECAVNDWDFQGTGSAGDGTYESLHDDVFTSVVRDEGDWTFTFINDWNSAGAATIAWTDMTVTLHKTGPPTCDDVTAVDWLSVNPGSGSTGAGSTTSVDVLIDTTGLAQGDHEAALCVATNDPAAPVVPVLVSLHVIGDGSEAYTPMALTVDPEVRASDGNGIFEPDETIDVAPRWRNDGDAMQRLTGTASDFTGPAGATYDLVLDGADYGGLEPGQTASCFEATGVCYALGLNDPAARPATHWEATFTETLDDTEATSKTWSLHVGNSFTDVPRESLFYRSIETLLHSGIASGCTGSEYCPQGVNTRSQMAIFLMRAAEGADFVPPPCAEGEERFDDVPADSLFCPWIEALAESGITSGCDGDSYCPADSVTRAQMAIFLLRAAEGAGYTPPLCTGEFSDVSCPSSVFAAWIEELAARGVTSGCSADTYCPGDAVTRAQMAIFVTKAFGLVLYGP